MSPAEHEILQAYADAGADGLTFDELVARIYPRQAVSGIASRPARLRKRGFIEETGEARISRWGKKNAVRRITETGREQVAACSLEGGWP